MIITSFPAFFNFQYAIIANIMSLIKSLRSISHFMSRRWDTRRTRTRNEFLLN